jgi:hypothetical protein
MDYEGIVLQFLVGAKEFSLLQNVWPGSGPVPHDLLSGYCGLISWG